MKGIILVLLFCFALSCTTTKLVEVPIEKTKTEYLNKILYDSIYIRDSIDRYTNGDTVFIYKQKTELKYKYKTDTIIKIDSIPYPVYIDNTVEVNKLKWYQSGLMVLGIVFILCILFIVLRR